MSYPVDPEARSQPGARRLVQSSSPDKLQEWAAHTPVLRGTSIDNDVPNAARRDVFVGRALAIAVDNPPSPAPLVASVRAIEVNEDITGFLRQ